MEQPKYSVERRQVETNSNTMPAGIAVDLRNSCEVIEMKQMHHMYNRLLIQGPWIETMMMISPQVKVAKTAEDRREEGDIVFGNEIAC